PGARRAGRPDAQEAGPQTHTGRPPGAQARGARAARSPTDRPCGAGRGARGAAKKTVMGGGRPPGRMKRGYHGLAPRTRIRRVALVSRIRKKTNEGALRNPALVS